jgi:NDP-sugar pyrophosphorylase family protein
MKVGIIAAGAGERLARGGIRTPKPLVPLHGQPMIARLIRTAARLRAESVACIINDLDPSVSSYLRSVSWPLPLELVVRTTPNSMESLLALAPFLRESPFLLLTVDAVFPFSALKKLIEAGEAMTHYAAILALTSNTDDEKPLWTRIDPYGRITAIGEAASGKTPYVTAGFYWFDPVIFSMAQTARAMKLDALRRFLALLLESGYPLYGLPVSETVDVDYPEDIAKAEAYLLKIGEYL